MPSGEGVTPSSMIPRHKVNVVLTSIKVTIMYNNSIREMGEVQMNVLLVWKYLQTLIQVLDTMKYVFCVYMPSTNYSMYLD